MTSNQGRDLSGVLEDVTSEHIRDITSVMREEIHTHPEEASCECPVLEVLARLYELGYTVTRT